MLVLVADHHAIVRTGLACFVEQLGKGVEVQLAQTFDESLDHLRKTRPDLVITGVLRGNGGLALQISDLCEVAQPAPVIVFADPLSPELVEGCLQAGAKAFVPKSTDDRHLIHILRLVLDGGNYVPREIVGPPARRLKAAGGCAAPSTIPSRLTNRQIDVLNCLRVGMSNNDIAEQLGLNLSTVKGHVSAVLKSLGVRNRTQAVIAARGTNT